MGRAGSLDSDFAVAESERTTRRERLYGDRVNGGGPRLELRTHNGDVRLSAR